MRSWTSTLSLVAACALAVATSAAAQPQTAATPIKTDDAAFAALMADNPDAQAAPPGHFSCDSKLGALLDDPAAHSVLARYMPGVVSSPQITLARGMTLKQLAGFKQAGIDRATLRTIDGELTALPPN